MKSPYYVLLKSRVSAIWLFYKIKKNSVLIYQYFNICLGTTCFFINFKYYEIMMKKLLLRVTTYALLLTASISFGQTIDLGTLSSFEAYTGSGTVLNS